MRELMCPDINPLAWQQAGAHPAAVPSPDLPWRARDLQCLPVPMSSEPAIVRSYLEQSRMGGCISREALDRWLEGMEWRVVEWVLTRDDRRRRSLCAVIRSPHWEQRQYHASRRKSHRAQYQSTDRMLSEAVMRR